MPALARNFTSVALRVIGARAGVLALLAAWLPVTLAAEPPATTTLFTPAELGLDRPRIDTAAALLLTLQASPQVRTQGYTVDLREGRLLVARSAFDPVLFSRVSAGTQQDDRDRPFSLEDNRALYEWESGLRQRFRNGITLAPSARVSRTETTRSPGTDSHRDQVGFGFDVVIPLARGRGRDANTAEEIAAGHDLEASRLTLRHVSASAVADTLVALWRCRATEQRLRLFAQNAEIAARLVDMAQAMVDAGELGRSLLSQVLADRESAVSRRVEGEFALHSARLRLALATGYSGPADTAPLPAEPLPTPESDAQVPDLSDLTATALLLRADLRATESLSRSGLALVSASRLNLRPAIDLQATVGASTYRGSGVLLAGQADRGELLSGSLALSVEWPVANRFALGRLAQDRALYEQTRVEIDDLRRRITFSVASSHAALRALIWQIRLLRAAAQLHGEALDVQQQLFQLGQSTLSDVITARQRLLQTELEYLAALENYAIGIIQLRFDTGTLLPGDEPHAGWIVPALWTTPPHSAPDASAATP